MVFSGSVRTIRMCYTYIMFCDEKHLTVDIMMHMMFVLTCLHVNNSLSVIAPVTRHIITDRLLFFSTSTSHYVYQPVIVYRRSTFMFNNPSITHTTTISQCAMTLLTYGIVSLTNTYWLCPIIKFGLTDV